MKFVAISDTHSRHYQLKLPKGDVLLHAGDISSRGKKEEVLDFLNWLGNLPYKHKIFIGGNHDFYLEKEKPVTIQQLLPKGVHYLCDSGIEIEGCSIWGSPVTPWFFNWAFNRKRGLPIKRHWDLIPPGTDVVLTHGPVYGIHDLVINEKHVGCQDLLQTLTAIQPKVHVCGHIHEATGNLQRNGIRFINACQLNESYELVYKPVTFEL